LLSVGASLGAPKNVILNDSSSYNYSSARLDAQTFERWAGVLQSLCVPILTSHLKTFLSVMSYHPDVAMLLGSYNTLEELPIKWYFPRPEHIDRQKEASADVTLIQNNCMSLRDFYARQGKDWRAELNQIAREKRLMQELGIEPNDVIDSFGDDDESDIG
jgi:capsid protein